MPISAAARNDDDGGQPHGRANRTFSGTKSAVHDLRTISLLSSILITEIVWRLRAADFVPEKVRLSLAAASAEWARPA